jgi:hypothetical protein
MKRFLAVVFAAMLFIPAVAFAVPNGNGNNAAEVCHQSIPICFSLGCCDIEGTAIIQKVEKECDWLILQIVFHGTISCGCEWRPIHLVLHKQVDLEECFDLEHLVINFIIPSVVDFHYNETDFNDSW